MQDSLLRAESGSLSLPLRAISSSSLLEYLHPPSRCSTLKQVLSPWRIGLSFLFAGATLALALCVDPQKFAVAASLNDIPNGSVCRKLCADTLRNDALAQHLGGYGICCTGNAGVHPNGQCVAPGRPLVHFTRCALTDSGAKGRCFSEEEDSVEVVASSGLWTTSCQFKVVKPLWMPLSTVALLAITVMLIVQGLPPEALLIGLAALLCQLGIIKRQDIFSGLVDKGVTSLAVLFPLAEAVQETGILERLVGGLLGKPRSVARALLRMTLAVALLSAILSNTATVALMIPIVLTWSTRLGVSPGKFLMPLSFAAQLGGTCTLIGSSLCFVAQGAVASVYAMGLLDLAPVGVSLTIVIGLLMSALTRTSLLASSASRRDASGAGPDGLPCSTDAYFVLFTVKPYGGVATKTVEDSGLSRLPGVDSVVAQALPASAVLKAGDILEVWCSEAGLVALRAQTGLQLMREGVLKMLGSKRRQRFLYEATVRAGSEFCGPVQDVLMASSASTTLRSKYGACYVAGPKSCQRGVPSMAAEGSVLLFEADETWVTDKASGSWQTAFSLIRQVPASSPLRTGRMMDNFRDATVCISVAGLIGLVAVNAAQLDGGGILVLLFLLLIGGLTLEQLFVAMKVRILFTIAGAIAVGSALENSGVIEYIAASILDATENPTVVVALFYAVGVFVSMFLNNSATVAILGPLIVSASTRKHPGSHVPPLWTSGRAMSWALIFGAGSCFTTPLGYQTNLMVMPAGQYTFGDFMRYGGVIQLVHMLCTLFLIKLYDWSADVLCSSAGVTSACYVPFGHPAKAAI